MPLPELTAGQLPLAGLVADVHSETAAPEIQERLRSVGLDPSIVRVVSARDWAFVGGRTGFG